MRPHITLFLSRSTPLARWDKLGLFERETALYRCLSRHVDMSIVSSGDEGELAYAARLGQMEILFNRWPLSANLYSLLAPWLHRSALRQADIYKTNQFDGSWTAILAARLYGKPVVVRAGYLWAENYSREMGLSSKMRLIFWLQAFVLRQATHVAVTTTAMKSYLADRYRLPARRITVIPNYVDTVQFGPDPTIAAQNGRLCFIGRLNVVKNLDLLIEALAPLPNTCLAVIGQGEEQDRLMALSRRLGASVEFLGQLPHEQLPAEINHAQLFVLPSRFEGHPKALIEAMACGTAVLGTDVEGIRDVIRHGETGWLCQPTVEGLRQAIQTLLAEPELCRRLGQNGRQFALENYSLEQIATQELALYRTLL
jgi:glycosyltransferase involved in cell wall biosynthesis